MPEPADRPECEDDPDFPSGPWTGYWLEGGCRFRQDLGLQFRKGCVEGEGIDTVGRFKITGTYDIESREVAWEKAYFGAYSVGYRGYREINGIWGVWENRGKRGGFHVWPRPEKKPEPAPQKERLEDEDEAVAAIEPGIIYG
ncbi:MAG: hypothetical protein IT457_02155 [Planctomycetes bacterium]|nr:hypothetical protein [Planctomycetota bacterium]